VRKHFDHVLVDEYQDTNALQATILLGLKPDGAGLTVVGDDAQAIYRFRAANVRNILDFPNQFAPSARVVTLEENYRSTQPILAASNPSSIWRASASPRTCTLIGRRTANRRWSRLPMTSAK
jgi:DNA helicase-2/ATP-dependent DNA helicase PcrA